MISVFPRINVNGVIFGSFIIVFVGHQIKNILHVLSVTEVTVLLPIIKLIQVAIVSYFSLNPSTSLYPPQATVSDGQTFDFIIVGAGSAGCVLANRLTEITNWNVLLIEAGDDPTGASNIPGLSVLLSTVLPDWNYFTVDDGFSSQGLKQKRIQNLRGKMLGGSSGINFMFYVRGNKIDYDNWAQEGNEGWDWDNVITYFKKSEKLDSEIIMNSDSADLHNTKGYLGVTQPNWSNETKEYFNAFKELGYNILLETNGHEQLGYSPSSFTIYNSTRQNIANAFLIPIKDRENLHVLRNTVARKMIFDEGNKATGVELKLSGGEIINVYANNEVILSAGALNTPKLLMLSGIGPKEHLKDMNIELVIDSPNVGKNMQDHALVPIALTGQKSTASLLDTIEPLMNLDRFPLPSMLGFVALNKSQGYPDYQITAVPTPTAALFPPLLCSETFTLEDSCCIALADATQDRGAFFALITLLHPKSRGQILLKSSDPADSPLIYSGFYSNKEDIENFAYYLEDYIRVVNTSYFKQMNSEVVDLNVSQCKDFEFGSHEYWKCYVLNLASTQYHACGTCAMGVEGKGVVDERLRLRGVTGLRVVDASVIPSITSGNLNAPVIMIAEKAADFIKIDNGVNV